MKLAAIILALAISTSAALAQATAWTCQAIVPGSGLLAVRTNAGGQLESTTIDYGLTINGWGAWACANDMLGKATLATRTNADGRQQSVQIDGSQLPP